MFGAQIQAMVLDDLLRGVVPLRFGARTLAALVCLCCLVGSLAVTVLPCVRRGQWQPSISQHWGCCVSVIRRIVVRAPDCGTTDTGARRCGLCVRAAGAVTLIAKLLHRRQLHLTPALIWSADGTTASATGLAASPHDPSASSSR